MNYTKQPMEMESFWKQVKKQLKKGFSWFLQNFMIVMLGIFLLFCLLFASINISGKQIMNKHLSIRIILLIIIVAIIFCVVSILYRQETETIMYVSYSNDFTYVRNSIEKFITDATMANSSVIAYDKNTTYLYFKKNILNILKSNENKDSKDSVLYMELQKLLKRYPYLPVAMIDNNTLKSLTFDDFIQMKSTKTDSSSTTTTAPPKTTESYTMFY